jgi:hypothetical protein
MQVWVSNDMHSRNHEWRTSTVLRLSRTSKRHLFSILVAIFLVALEDQQPRRTFATRFR